MKENENKNQSKQKFYPIGLVQILKLICLAKRNSDLDYEKWQKLEDRSRGHIPHHHELGNH